MRRPRLFLPLLVVMALIVAACSGDDGDSATTVAAGGGSVTSLAPEAGAAGATGGGAGGDEASADTTTTAAPAAETEIPEYTIVSREPGEDGDTVVVLLDPTSYGLLTDIDLQNVISEVFDDAPPVHIAHVIDSEDVAQIVVAAPAEVDAEGQRLLDLHHLASLEDGFRIVFKGPFEESGSVVLGS